MRKIFKQILLKRHSGKRSANWRRAHPESLSTIKQTKEILESSFLLPRMTARAGFTLVELLIYMGIISILFVVLTQIFGSILDAQLESEATSSVQQDGRFILSRLSYDIRRADSIIVPATLGTTSTSLQLTISGVSYTYSLNGGNLELTEGVNTNKINGSETTISSLSFTRLGNSVPNAKNTIQIEYTVTTKVIQPKGLETKDFQTTIGIR